VIEVELLFLSRLRFDQLAENHWRLGVALITDIARARKQPNFLFSGTFIAQMFAFELPALHENASIHAGLR
jgi:hypothetical protein